MQNRLKKISGQKKIRNPFTMNDWEIKKFFTFILFIQITLLTLISLNNSGIQIPILREVIGFIFLTYVPGILLVRILKIHKIGSAKTILLSTGLSIATLMFTGLFINIIYPYFGIKPISLIPLIITISFITVVLSVVCYLRDKYYSEPDYISIDDLISPWVLTLCLIPFLSIIGTFIFNTYGNNSLQIAIILIIATFPIIALKWMPEKYFSLSVFITSISLLYHTSLVSANIWGADINLEYYLSNLVLENLKWNAAIMDNYNGMLSVMILSPIYSLILKMDLKWILKIVYPTLFSFVPIGLFIISKKITNNKVAFLSSFFFMSSYAFYTVLPALARQEIAELFLILLVILIIEKSSFQKNKSILAIIFGSSLIVSHYGITYILILLMIIARLIIYGFSNKIPHLIVKNEDMKMINPKIVNYLLVNDFPNKIHYLIRENITKKMISAKILNYFPKFTNDEKYVILNKKFITIFIIFSIVWYYYVSSTSILYNGVGIGISVFSSITDLFNPTSSQGMSIISSALPFFQSIEKYLNLISQLFILIGLISILRNKNKFNNEFKAFSVACVFILGASVILPFFAGYLNTDRILHISLFFLAPFFVIGLIKVIQLSVDFIKKIKLNNRFNLSINPKKSLYFASTFLIVFFLFNSAFIYQIFDQPKAGRFALDNNVDFPVFNIEEMESAKWLSETKNPTIDVYADSNRIHPLNSLMYNLTEIDEWNLMNETPESVIYVYFGTFNIQNHQFFVQDPSRKTKYIPDPMLESKMSKIYDNNRSYILLS